MQWVRNLAHTGLVILFDEAEQVPSLRQRKEDIPLLVDHLVHKLNRELGKNVTGIEHSCLERLSTRDWPGNVRQMENVLRRAMVHAHGEVLLEETVVEALGEKTSSDSGEPVPAIPLLDQVEKDHILKALRYANGNKGKVCSLLGISRPTLQRKIRKYKLEKWKE